MMRPFTVSSAIVRKGIVVGILAAVVAGIFLLRMRMFSVPLERDEGEYAYMGQLLLQGIPPYGEAYTMKLPGVCTLYAVMFAIGGESKEAIHCGLAIVNGISILLIFAIGRRLIGAYPALAAAAIFGLLSLSERVLGFAAHATHFVMLFVLAGIYLLLLAFNGRKSGVLFAAGLCFGAAIVMKQHAAAFALFALGAVFVTGRREGWKHLVMDFLIIAAGMALPLAGVALWMASAPALTNFWFWTYTYAAGYAAPISFHDGMINLYFALQRLILSSPAAWTLGLAGAVTGFVYHREHERPWFLIFFLIASLISILPGFYYREHYFVMLLPAVSIAAGVGLQRVADLLKRIDGIQTYRWIPVTVAFYFFAVVVVQQLRGEKAYLFHRTPAEISMAAYGINPFAEMETIADTIAAHTGAGDRIAVIGSEPEVYFRSHRRSATPFIYFYPLVEPQPYAGAMQSQLIRDIENAKPVYIVLTGGVYLRMGSMKKPAQQILDWLPEYLDAGYDLVCTVDMAQEEPRATWHWGGEEIRRITRNDFYVQLFRKKNLSTGAGRGI